MFFGGGFPISGLQHAWQLSPLLVHAAALDPQEQGEEVIVVHGTGGPAALILQAALGLRAGGKNA